MRVARRIESLPPYLFAEIDRKIGEARARGVDIVSFGVGDPDLPTAPHIVEALVEAARDASTHRYPSYTGLPRFRSAIAAWYERRFGVNLDPETQIQPLVGSKEGIFHLPVAFVDPGDSALVPDPGYPVYETGTLLAGGRAVPMQLAPESGFLVDLGAIEQADADAARVMWLNYPSNPTAAAATSEFFDEAVAFCRRRNLLLAHDAAYTEITFDGYIAPSVLQADGAMDCAVEFHSLSKTYNMTGWRIGWVAGAPQAIGAIKTLKTNIDSGIFDAVQQAGVAALEGPQDHLQSTLQTYRRRRDLLCDALKAMGVVVEPPKASIYIWAPVPEGYTSESFTTHLLERAGVVVAPGNSYGRGGEGYVRFSLTLPDDRLELGVERLREVLT